MDKPKTEHDYSKLMYPRRDTSFEKKHKEIKEREKRVPPANRDVKKYSADEEEDDGLEEAKSQVRPRGKYPNLVTTPEQKAERDRKERAYWGEMKSQ